ncbi:MAG: hypothetical protein D6736_21275, partial [Nitrospinota bacterium]
DLQYHLVLFSLCHLLFFLLAVGTALFAPLMLRLHGDEAYFAEMARAAEQLLYLHTHFWPVALIAALVICLHTIAISHKVAGPLYRLRQFLQAMQQGHLPPPLRLRHGDYLHKDIEVINEMVSILRTKMAEIQAEQEELNKAIVELQAVVKQASREEIITHMARVAEKGERLAEKLSYFQIDT